MIEEDTEIKQKKIKDFEEYLKFLRQNEIILDHKKRAEFILEKIKLICKNKSFQESIDQSLLLEVSNLVDKPRIILEKFD